MANGATSDERRTARRGERRDETNWDERGETGRISPTAGEGF
jgi:hypothetical protein